MHRNRKYTTTYRVLNSQNPEAIHHNGTPIEVVYTTDGIELDRRIKTALAKRQRISSEDIELLSFCEAYCRDQILALPV
ncbi:MAG: hypothetical protein WCJ74_01770 [bacterium]